MSKSVLRRFFKNFRNPILLKINPLTPILRVSEINLQPEKVNARKYSCMCKIHNGVCIS